MVAGGSLQLLPARVMSDLPRWHTQRCGRCLNSRYFYGQRDADYVFGQNVTKHNPAPSPSGHPLLFRLFRSWVCLTPTIRSGPATRNPILAANSTLYICIPGVWRALVWRDDDDYCYRAHA